MGEVKNIVNILTGKQKNHVYHESGSTWGFATGKGLKLKRLEPTDTVQVAHDTLYEEGYDYVFTGALSNDSVGHSADEQVRQRLIRWQTEKNRLVAYNKISAISGLPACFGITGILRCEPTNDRILQMHYYGYSASGKELFMVVSKKCPAALAAKLPSINHTDIAKEMNDVYTIVTSVRISE